MQTVATESRLISEETKRVALRFVWKELRMLRGLAVGVIGLTLAEMAVLRTFLPADSVPNWMLISAFGGAALFAVAAAVTLFAVEREVGTTALLELLPQNRVALLAGKVLAALAMTLAVLGVLAAVTYGTGLWPDATNAQAIVGQGFVAIVEALAYGLLMSLLCPNPLLAAVLAMAAASFNSQLAMLLSVDNFQGFSTREFQIATPMRLTIAALVGAIDVWLGLNWLRSMSSPRRQARVADVANRTNTRPRKLGMFGRLMWQSVRESWKTMLAATVIGLVLMFATDLVVGTQLGSRYQWLDLADFDFHLPISVLFLPALYGALAFRADQRRQQFRFLAEHAGRARMIWLSRQLIWLAPTVLWCSVVSLFAWFYGLDQFFEGLTSVSRGNYAFGLDSDGQLSTAMLLNIELNASFWWHVSMVFWAGSLTAYALGQFLSLALRSDIFAGLLSLGGSIVLLGWAYVVIAWRLPALWSLAPLTVGLILASWLRASDWLASRTGVRQWLWPVVATIAPVIAVLSFVPPERAEQVSPVYRALSLDQMHPIANEEYINRLAEQGHPRGIELQNELRDRFAWSRQLAPLFKSSSGYEYSVESLAQSVRKAQAVGREVAKDYAQLADRVSAADRLDGRLDAQVIELSRRAGRLPGQGSPFWKGIVAVHKIALARAAEVRSRDLAASLELLLAARRIEAQADISLSDSVNALAAWATSPGQSRQLLKRAIDELGEINRNWPLPMIALMDDYSNANLVIRGEANPSFLIGKRRGSSRDWLAFYANQLPGESSRAERALDILALAALDYYAGLLVELQHIDGLATSQASQSDRARAANKFRERLLPWMTDHAVSSVVSDGLGGRPVIWERAKLVRAAETSYLAAREFGWLRALSFRQWLADLTRRRAELVWLALLAFKLEHGEYPETLQQLVPDYLTAREIVDPYAAAPFGYQPKGFDKWAFGHDRNGYIQKKWYPPQTPLLWSVGIKDASPQLGMAAYAMSDSGERVRLEEREREDGRFLVSFPAEPAIVLKGAGADDGWGEFWLPLPSDSVSPE